MNHETPERTSQAIDYKLLAAELSAAFNSKDDLAEKEKHAAQHKMLDEILPFSPLILEICRDIQERRERRKRIIEKITGAVVVSILLAVLGTVGRYMLEEYKTFSSQNKPQTVQVIKTESATP